MAQLAGYRSIDPLSRTAPTDAVAELARVGLVLLEWVDGVTALRSAASGLFAVAAHRDSGADGVTMIADRGRLATMPGMAGFGAAALPVHTDRSGVAEPPALLMTVCLRSADTGGEALLVDGQAVYEDLAEHDPAALDALSTPRSVLFGSAGGHLGAVFTPTAAGRVAVRLRRDGLVRFSPSVARALPALDAALDRHTRAVRFSAGEGYLLDNHRWLHGRRGFTGPRVLGRVLGNPHPATELRTVVAPAITPPAGRSRPELVGP